jgi:hypothetical protein
MCIYVISRVLGVINYPIKRDRIQFAFLLNVTLEVDTKLKIGYLESLGFYIGLKSLLG